MSIERLYNLAFQYKKTKLWKRLFDDEIFAIKLSDGIIGYCCVMGMEGDQISLSVYAGEDKFQTYWMIADFEGELFGEDGAHDILLTQDCLQCSFENKSSLLDEELTLVRAYARANGLSLKGRNSFPRFLKYRPNRMPWSIETEQEEQYICEALEAALALASMLNHRSKREIGIHGIYSKRKKIPFFEYKDGALVMSSIPLPTRDSIDYYSVPMQDMETAEKIKEMKKNGIYECEMIRIPSPIQENENEAPYFPVMLMCVQSSGGVDHVLPIQPVIDYHGDSKPVLNAFISLLLSNESPPKAIKVHDLPTCALLKDLCVKTGILLIVENWLETLERVREPFLEYMLSDSAESEVVDPEEYPDDEDLPGDWENIMHLFQFLMQLNDQEIKMLPNTLIHELMDMADSGYLPPELETRLRRIFSET